MQVNNVNQIDKINFLISIKMNQSSTSVGINLRSKGLRNTSGALIKGCVKDATSKLSIGSIPSNYETIIYHSQSSKAFGTSQKRFYQQSKLDLQKTDLPNDSLLTEPEPNKNPSHSTKGYGPLIAKQQRNWIEKKQAPGPGRYEFIKTAEPSAKRLKRKKAGIFPQKKQNILPIDKLQNQLPGPGQYHIYQKNHANNGWKSAFKTKLNRTTYLQKQNTPGPGYYDIKLIKHAKSIIKQPIADTEKSSPKKTLQLFEAQKPDDIPGPGSYQYQLPTFKPLYERIKISGNFILSKKDRFNNYTDKIIMDRPQNQSPNVYTYDLKSGFDQEQRLIKWPCFMSQSKRMVFSNEKKLGPSFITPKDENRKNFHFNIKGAWF